MRVTFGPTAGPGDGLRPVGLSRGRAASTACGCTFVHCTFLQVAASCRRRCGARDGIRSPPVGPHDLRHHPHPQGASCMKPTLASALALGCVSAALVATAGNSQAAPHPLRPRRASITAARSNAQQHAGVGRGQGLVVKDTVLDSDGASHVRFSRTFHGLEVVGGDFVVHQAQGGAFRSVSGRTIVAVPAAHHRLGHARRPPPQGRRRGRLRRSRMPPRPGRPRRAPRARAGLAGRRHRPQRRRLPRRRVRLRRRPQRPGPRQLALGPRGHRLRHRRGQRHRLAGTTLSGGQYTLVDASPRRQRDVQRPAEQQLAPRSSPTPTTSGATAPRPTATVGRRRRALRRREDLGLLQERPTAATASPTTARAPLSRVHYGRNYGNAFWTDGCFCMTYGDGDGTTSTRWSRSTSPATR